jgi:hypothetical protein
MRLKLRVLAAILAGSLAPLTVLPVGPAQAGDGVLHSRTMPVTGVVDNGAGAFAGTFTPDRFVAADGRLMAAGTLDGTLTDAAGKSAGSVSDVPATFPVTVAQATCAVLDLSLGQIDLRLLGLQVLLEPIHLNVSAEEGGLIGTVFCLIAGLLRGGAPLPATVDPLNRLLPLL